MTTENQGSDQADSSGTSTPAAGPVPLENPRNYFEDKLKAERGESSDDDQSQGDEGEEDEQTSGKQTDQADDGADDADENSDEQSDTDEDGDDSESDSDDDPDSDDQADDDEESTTLQVDDRQYSADDIKALEKKTTDLEAGYRQTTQEIAARRTEYEKDTQELEAVGMFFKNLTAANVQALEKMDLSAMSPEQVQAWQAQYNSTKSGAAQVEGQIGKLLKGVRDAVDKMKDHAAAESIAVLKGSEPRWNDAFYAKVREFAVSSKRYSAQEFGDITDWRTIEGLIAVMDKDQVVKIAKPSKDPKKAKTVDKPAQKRRRQNKKVRRDSAGKFATARTKVLESGNARQDGTFREMLQAKLANERR